MKTSAEHKIERWLLDNFSLDDYDFIADENDDLKRIVSDGSLEAVILLSVSDSLFEK
jgi:hypothetical protein